MIFKEFFAWLGCKINKILALLSILVLTMLLSCAFGRTITGTEIANFILNGYDYYSNDVTPYINTIGGAARMSNWNTLADTINEHEGQWFCGYSNQLKRAFFCYVTGSQTNLAKQNYVAIESPYNGNTQVQGSYFVHNNSSTLTFHSTYYDIETDTLNTQTYSSTSNNMTYANYTRLNDQLTTASNRWYYFDRIARFTYYGNYIQPGTAVPTTIFDENFVTGETWQFNSAWSQTVNISGDSTVDYYVVDPSYIYTVLGILQDSSLCYGAGYEILAFNKSTNTWEGVYDWGEYFTASNPISNYFSTGDINGIPTSSIKLRSNLVLPDTIIHFTFSRGNSASDLNKQIDAAFYVRGSHTVISGDYIDYDSTFSDPDYYNDYQYEVDGLVNMAFDDTLNDINDTLQNDDNVPSLISDYFGSSGEVAEKLGYVDYSGDNPYGNIFLTIINGLKQVLMTSEDVILSCTIHGQTFTFNSGDFQNPSGVLKALIIVKNIFP